MNKTVWQVFALSLLLGTATAAHAEPTDEAACKRVVDTHIQLLKSGANRSTGMAAAAIEKLRETQSECAVYAAVHSDIVDQ